MKMRRTDREIKERGIIDEIINKAEICRIAVCDGDIPYIVPANYGYDGKNIYIHSAKAGRKVEVLKKNNNVCFEVDVDQKLIRDETACKWTIEFRSVIGFGKAYFVEDTDEKTAALDLLMKHYEPEKKFTYNDKMVKDVGIIRIELDEVTGKYSGKKEID